MNRVPVRLRVTLAFAAAMGLLLAALGAFLWFEMRARLDESIDDTLRSRLAEVSGLVATARSAGSPDFPLPGEEDETFVQLLDDTGIVVYSSGSVAGAPLLTRGEAQAVGDLPVEFERPALKGVEGGARLLAVAQPENESGLRVVVGAALDDRDETLASLTALLLLGGPIALLIASLAGYWVAGRALHPVEAMRRRAAEISAAEPGERLPVPPARDELGRLGETLNAMLARLEAALERERRFVDDASHELRTPLALHRAELELALRHGEEDPERLRASIESAIEEIDRLIALAEALLVVARSGDESIDGTGEPIAVGDLLAGVGERFRGAAEREGRDLTVVAPDDLLVTGDRLRLDQALTALLDNAFRHGGGAVELRAEAGHGQVTFHVRDRGTGFPDEFIPRAFERFSRPDAARTRGGTGLGLAIVDAIARAHGGAAGARNAPGGGADVWIQLPVQDVASLLVE